MENESASRNSTLKELSDAATPGPWEHGTGPSLKGSYHTVDAPETMVAEAYCVLEMHDGTADDDEKRQAADCAFVVALVNAYRAGELAPVSERLALPPMEADETDALLRAIENGVRNVLDSTPLVVAQYAYQALFDEQAKSAERNST